MPVPATTGQLRTNIDDMVISDYIAIHYNQTVAAYVLSQGSLGELPVGGASESTSLNKHWYMVKVDKGLLVADRVWQVSRSWDSLNASKSIQGVPRTIGGVEGYLRSLSGGVAHADENGNKSSSDKGFGGWPINNEWDRYISHYPTHLILEGSSLDDVFHWLPSGTWCQETTANGITRLGSSIVGSNTMRVYRPYFNLESSGEMALVFNQSNLVSSEVGFRPVFEYREEG